MEYSNPMKYINSLVSFLNKSKWFLIYLILGLAIFSYPMITSDFDKMPGNGYDIKSLSYILEHSFLWLSQTPSHHFFWNLPFYYPTPNTLAYSDACFGLMPIYWLARTMFDDLSAIQAMMLIISAINYSVFYYLLKKQFNYSHLASALGSFIFAFGLMRLFRMVHLNYYGQYLTILSMIFFLKVKKDNTVLKNNIYFLLAAGFMALQFYTCYSLAYYFCLTAFFAFLISFAFKSSREYVIQYLKDFWRYLIGYFIVFIVILIPYMYHYLSLGVSRSIDDINTYLQGPLAWIRNVSILDNLFFNKLPYVTFYTRDEITASSGIFTTLLALWGITKLKHKWIYYSSLAFIFLCSCSIFGLTFWYLMYYIAPGAQGIRAIIRISFIALIIVAIAIAALVNYFQENISKKHFRLILCAIVLLITIENIPYYEDPHSDWNTFGWSKAAFNRQINDIIKMIPKDYRVIGITMDFPIQNPYMLQDEAIRDANYKQGATISALAMWASIRTNRYTVNGLSGLARIIPPDKDEKIYTIMYNFGNNPLDWDDNKYLFSKY